MLCVFPNVAINKAEAAERGLIEILIYHEMNLDWNSEQACDDSAVKCFVMETLLIQ
jgi:hypothetical protein